MTPEEEKSDKSEEEISEQKIRRVKSDQFQIIPMMEPPEKVKKKSD